jgi:Eco57I restriction-modification methylase
MAFDQTTRNQLQRFVLDARSLLTDEFTRQLQQHHGLDPETGDVAELETLTHIDDQTFEIASLLREIMAHYEASDMVSGQEGQKSVLNRIAREQAFTVLNRLVALRMMEARGLLRQSVGSGFQSEGFQLYERLAGRGLGDTGEAYQIFLFSLFDEFSQEMPQLFDRYSAHGQLFPRERILVDLLALINAANLEHLWTEDETIGWIYQYFNSAEERKKMRDEGKSGPRNSRELAVRNQFFTPRYVVEFLVDNSLGRQWYNYRGGDSNIFDKCQYLLVKPDDPKPEPPERLPDPRSIRLLDPACGSMHFGLYAYDIFELIYKEAWAIEQDNGSDALQREMSIEPLTQVYRSQLEFLTDLPRLILKYNIFGVEIDSRAAQIATLALWLRAQRTWHDAGVTAEERPTINTTNVIAAIAPPTEPDIQESIATTLNDDDAKLFVETLKMLKGLPELGVLLRIEKELPALIKSIFKSHGPMFDQENTERWQDAESRLREALVSYIKESQSTYQGRLFAQDALEGLKLIDLTRLKFHAVVMNPPFGALSLGVKKQLTKEYPRSKNDLLAIFVERGLELLNPGGRLGAITSRTCFFLSSYQKWREEIVLGIAEPEIMADLGHGVMDDAMVEAAVYVLEKKNDDIY